MNFTKHKGMKRRISAFLMSLMVMFGVAHYMAVPAYAAGGAPASAAPAGGSNGIWDIVGDDGSINSGSTVVTQGQGQGFTTVITQYRAIATAIMGVLTITMLIFMLIQITKLGASGDNEMARKKAIGGILTTGIATALLGGVTIVIGFFWNILIS